MSDVAVIIPTFNAASHLDRCLKSIQLLDYDRSKLEIAVIDDASADDTEKIARVRLEEMGKCGFGRLSYRRLETQKGAPAALNEALRMIAPSADFIWKLDSDTELASGSLKSLVGAASLKENEDVGAFVSSIMRPSGKNEASLCTFAPRPQLWTKTLRYFTASEYDADRDGSVIGLHGASLLLRAKALSDSGSFDERFTIYYDDTDLCLRMVRAHYRLGLVPESVVIHHKIDRQGTVVLPALYFLLRNQLLFARKHLSLLDFFCLVLLQPIVLPWRFVRLCSQYGLWSLKGMLGLISVWFVAWSDFLLSRYQRCPSQLMKFIL